MIWIWLVLINFLITSTIWSTKRFRQKQYEIALHRIYCPSLNKLIFQKSPLLEKIGYYRDFSLKAPWV